MFIETIFPLILFPTLWQIDHHSCHLFIPEISTPPLCIRLNLCLESLCFFILMITQIFVFNLYSFLWSLKPSTTIAFILMISQIFAFNINSFLWHSSLQLQSQFILMISQIFVFNLNAFTWSLQYLHHLIGTPTSLKTLLNR